MEWYAKLEAEKFPEIEYVWSRDESLKRYHGQDFQAEAAILRKEARERYNEQVTVFINHESLHEFCSLIAKHGNKTIGPKEVKRILEMHDQGWTERRIAEAIRRGKKCVHLTLKKAREWMKVA
jgi:hypothetical protein